jgi:hypothetical protein
MSELLHDLAVDVELPEAWNKPEVTMDSTTTTMAMMDAIRPDLESEDDSPMYTITEYITPERAQFYLEKNKTNRKVSWAAVGALAYDMATGAFVMTEQGIAFDANGGLVDGQHRLHAIIRSGRAQTMRVTFNAPSIEAPRDRGRIRAIGDFLLDGAGDRVEQSKRVAALSSAIELLESGREERMTVARTRERFESHRAGITWVVANVSAKMPAFLQAPLVYAYPSNPKGVADFAAAYASLAGLDTHSPVLALYRAVCAMTAYSAFHRREIMLRALRCIQLFLLGRGVQRVAHVDDALAYFRYANQPSGAAARA